MEHCRRPNVNRVQNTFSIWLDESVDKHSEDYQCIVSALRSVVNAVETFSDSDECIQCIKRNSVEKINLIISGSLGQNIVPQIHGMRQIYSIFIFCENERFHKQWAKQWPKVQGVFNDVKTICTALKETAHICEKNSTSISFAQTRNQTTTQSTNNLDPMFMYTQLIIEILLSIQFSQQHVQEFIEHCRKAFAGNLKELKNVDEFAKSYNLNDAIWWYSYEGFLYPMLNRALRLTEMNIVVKMGFFIADLHRQIEVLHKIEFQKSSNHKPFTVFRGQVLSQNDFQHLHQTIGSLMAFTNFVSTSKSDEISLSFAQHSMSRNPDAVGILFQMYIDPSKSTTPFASIKMLAACPDEDEILISMHAVFRIESVTPFNSIDNLYIVKLSLTSDDDKELRSLMASIRQDNYPEAQSWYRLGLVLRIMGYYDDSLDIFQKLLSETTEPSEKLSIYENLGLAKYNKGEYQIALSLFEEVLAMQNRMSPPPSLHLIFTYGNIGNVYGSMGQYSMALSSYKKALETQQQILHDNDPDLAASYSNIGEIYRENGKYEEALSFHEKALQIRRNSLPDTHPDLALSLSAIGNVYQCMGKYSEELSYHKKALEVRMRSLPPNHPDIASAFNNIGRADRNLGKYTESLISLEKALKIRIESLPSTHPDTAASYNNIGKVHSNRGDYMKALSSYEQALEIQEQSLRPNHSDLAATYNNIGNVYDHLKDYERALFFHEKALKIKKEIFVENHPSLAVSYNNIGNIYKHVGKYSEALSLHKDALKIQEQAYHSDHPELAITYSNIGNIFRKLSQYKDSLLFHQRALVIRQKSLPSDHSDLGSSYYNIARIHEDLGHYPEACSCCDMAVDNAKRSLPREHPAHKARQESLQRMKRKLS